MDTALIQSVVWLAVFAVPGFAFAGVAYLLLSLPMRRAERARFFLELLDQGIRDGRTPERTILAISESRDTSMGVRFHLLAAHIECGSRLSEALAKVPRLLPPQIVAVLKAGEEIGDVGRVLPACRPLLKDAVSQTRGAINYLILCAFVFTPVAPAIYYMLIVFVFPEFLLIMQDMETQIPPMSQFVLGQGALIANILIVGALAIYLIVIAYVGGPRLARWFRWSWFPLTDWMAYRLPWRRKRMLRNFAGMLGILLDLNIPEPKALKLAATAAANLIFEKRVEYVTEALRAGQKLPDALDRLDGSREFVWRLRNATHGILKIQSALRGWLEMLDAKAFQQQQAAAQLVTTALVMFNGLMIGSLAAGAFGCLISIFDSAVLW